jgi:hypothetical protein
MAELEGQNQGDVICDGPPRTEGVSELQLRRAAEKGDVDAKYYLGTMYLEGRGVPRDREEAESFLRSAAALGDGGARQCLHLLGAPKSAKEVEEIRAAAEGGDASAQYELGLMYFDGRGVSRNIGNIHHAARWLRLAAEQGFPAAQYRLGRMIKAGQGHEEDYREGSRWITLAANRGSVPAQIAIAKGFVSSVSEEDEVRWTRLWAEQGIVPAQERLARFHKTGRGVAEDYVQAYAWYSLAGAGPDPELIKKRDEIAREMTQDQIAEAERLGMALHESLDLPAPAPATPPVQVTLKDDLAATFGRVAYFVVSAVALGVVLFIARGCSSAVIPQNH